jgi:hypothetical protein
VHSRTIKDIIENARRVAFIWLATEVGIVILDSEEKE